jgi:phosphoribosyl 1,2-cyclic phosphodiesterase
MLTLRPLASGSSGNCSYIENEQSAFLVDCGIPYQSLIKELAKHDLDIIKLKAVFITHEHYDHCRGLPELYEKLTLPVYATEKTAEQLRKRQLADKELCVIEKDVPFTVEGATFKAVPVSHDAVDSVIFTLVDDESKVAVVTDLGMTSTALIEELQGCQSLLLEANYCPELLEASDRPLVLKNRIKSDTGHLSNEQCMTLMSEVLHPGLKELFIGHISEVSNDYALIREMLKGTLDKCGGFKVKAQVLRRYSE